MTETERSFRRSAAFRNLMDIGLSSILLVTGPLIVLGYGVSLGIILLPLGIGIPLGIGCFTIHTVFLITGFALLIIPRVMARKRENDLKRKMEGLPEEEKRKLEKLEITTFGVFMGYTPMNEENKPLIIPGEKLIEKGSWNVSLDYRDFRGFTGWDHYSGPAKILVSDIRVVVIPEGDKRAISLFRSVNDSGRKILGSSKKRKRGKIKIKPYSSSGRRILSRVLPMVVYDHEIEYPSKPVELKNLADIYTKDMSLVEDIIRQKEILDVWTR